MASFHDSKETLSKSKALPAIVFDTETTGLPPWHRDPQRLHDWDGCRLVQFAWMVIGEPEGDHEGAVSTYNSIVKPTNFTISPQVTAIHGISHEHAVAEGRDLEEVLHAFQVTLERFPDATLVAHNIEFDMSLIVTEAKRLEMTRLLSLLGNLEQHCTMKTAVLHNKRRWPKLGVLYKELFNVEAEGRAHDAMWDVMTCAQIYTRQVKLI